RQPLLLLLLVAKVVDGRGAQTDAGLQGDGDRLVDLGELLEGDAQGEVVAAHAAVLLGERQAEQAHLAHLLDDLVGEGVVAVVLVGDGVDDPVGEVADDLLQFAVLGGQIGGVDVGHFGCSLVCARVRCGMRGAGQSSSGVTVARATSVDTWEPAATWYSTTPAVGARSVCSIFMASTTRTGSPASTRSPSAADRAMTVPGIGEVSVPSPEPSSSAAERTTFSRRSTQVPSSEETMRSEPRGVRTTSICQWRARPSQLTRHLSPSRWMEVA